MLLICYNQSMNVTQTNPETLVVCRDGQLDDQYYEAIYAEKRRAALHAAGREVLDHLQNVPKMIGSGIVYLLTPNAEQVKHG